MGSSITITRVVSLAATNVYLGNLYLPDSVDLNVPDVLMRGNHLPSTNCLLFPRPLLKIRCWGRKTKLFLLACINISGPLYILVVTYCREDQSAVVCGEDECK